VMTVHVTILVSVVPIQEHVTMIVEQQSITELVQLMMPAEYVEAWERLPDVPIARRVTTTQLLIVMTARVQSMMTVVIAAVLV
jgi:hypothetical protein